MGHKGVSKRKLKKPNQPSNANISGSSSVRSGEHMTVQALVKEQGAPLHRGGMNPSAGSNKTQKKR